MWVGDITYIATSEGWVYLAVVIDLFSRQIVGWSLRDEMTGDLVINALRMAWFKRNPGSESGLIFHSERGSQYASEDCRQVLRDWGITASMSRRGTAGTTLAARRCSAPSRWSGCTARSSPVGVTRRTKPFPGYCGTTNPDCIRRWTT